MMMYSVCSFLIAGVQTVVAILINDAKNTKIKQILKFYFLLSSSLNHPSHDSQYWKIT